MKQKLVALIAFGLLIAQSDEADAARSNRRAGSRSRSSNVRISGTTTSVSATVADTTTVSTDYTKPAPITDAVAKRNCTRAVVKGLQDYCGKNKCRNATEAFSGFTFPANEMIGENRLTETFCANFIEEAVNNLWNDYDSYAKNDKKVCNIAKARATAAESCYQYAIANGNKKARVGIKEVFSEDELDDYCGTEAIKKQYALYADGDVLSDGDVGTSLTTPFSRVGMSGWSNLAAFTRLIDLKFDTRSNEWPREIVQLVNSINTQGQIACGRDFAAQLKDTSFQLVDKSGSLEKRINEKGLFAGVKDWGVDQIGAFKGTNWADKAKAGKTTEERAEAKNLEEAKEIFKKTLAKENALSEDNKKLQEYTDYKNYKDQKLKGKTEKDIKKEDIEAVNKLKGLMDLLEDTISKSTSTPNNPPAGNQKGIAVPNNGGNSVLTEEDKKALGDLQSYLADKLVADKLPEETEAQKAYLDEIGTYVQNIMKSIGAEKVSSLNSCVTRIDNTKDNPSERISQAKDSCLEIIKDILGN